MTEHPDDPAAVSAGRRRGRVRAASRWLRNDVGYGVLSSAFAGYLRAVWATNRLTSEPATSEVLFAGHAPFIATTWHGQAFLLPFLRPSTQPVDVMVSRAGDGEMIGRALVKLGCGTVRGSGAADPARMFEKGAVAAFRALKGALDRGHSVLMTADFSRQARRQASPGLIALARLSQRPVVPLAVATSRRRELRSWDRTVINLPFGRAAFVYGEPVFVPPRADESVLEEKRLAVENALNVVTARAYEIADRRRG